MIDLEKYSDHIDNKASHCAKLLNNYYQKYNEQKGTQFVFSDLGTYKPGECVFSTPKCNLEWSSPCSGRPLLS